MNDEARRRGAMDIKSVRVKYYGFLQWRLSRHFRPIFHRTADRRIAIGHRQLCDSLEPNLILPYYQPINRYRRRGHHHHELGVWPGRSGH